MIWNFTEYVQYNSVLIIVAGSTSSFYNLMTRGPTTGGALTLEDELVWLVSVEEGTGRGYIVT